MLDKYKHNLEIKTVKNVKLKTATLTLDQTELKQAEHPDSKAKPIQDQTKLENIPPAQPNIDQAEQERLKNIVICSIHHVTINKKQCCSLLCLNGYPLVKLNIKYIKISFPQ